MTETTAGPALRYDGFTVALHWLTALLVIMLFALAEIWGFLPHGTSLRRGLQSLHMSLGVVLVMLFVVRLAWRLSRGRHLPPVPGRVQRLAAQLVHLALYGLLAAQLSLGLLFAWSRGHAIQFFWVLPIPAPLALADGTRHLVADLHYYIAWTIILLAGAHAAAALWHHYIRRDDVLRRMAVAGTSPRPGR
jgi:cytochrome b561